MIAQLIAHFFSAIYEGIRIAQLVANCIAFPHVSRNLLRLLRLAMFWTQKIPQNGMSIVLFIRNNLY
jgi:hypothetical protein